jgi:hypothetical protein
MSERDAKWMTQHSMELQEKYAGKWIAVYGEEVVGVGDTALEAAQQARRSAKPGDYILHAFDRETDVIYGCF